MNRSDSSHPHQLHHPRASASKVFRLLIAASLTVGVVACDDLPGKPPPNPAPVISVATTAGFEGMWAERCSGCHGADGQLGAGLPMRNAEYLNAVPDDDMFSMIRNGVPSSRMPGFGGDAIGGGAIGGDAIGGGAEGSGLERGRLAVSGGCGAR